MEKEEKKEKEEKGTKEEDERVARPPTLQDVF